MTLIIKTKGKYNLIIGGKTIMQIFFEQHYPIEFTKILEDKMNKYLFNLVKTTLQLMLLVYKIVM